MAHIARCYKRKKQRSKCRSQSAEGGTSSAETRSPGRSPRRSKGRHESGSKDWYIVQHMIVRHVLGGVVRHPFSCLLWAVFLQNEDP